MKKYLFGCIAIIMALSAAAFPKFKNNTSFYWYKRTGLNMYSFVNQGVDPSVPCPGGTVICAKGFLAAQQAGAIKDNTLPDDHREKN